MKKVILFMTTSLDGYINDRRGKTTQLFPDLNYYKTTPVLKYMIENTGAVVMGRKTFEMTENPDSYADTYEFQVPIFIVTHNVPAVKPKENDKLSFHFVPAGLQQAVQRAKQTAGSKKRCYCRRGSYCTALFINEACR